MKRWGRYAVTIAAGLLLGVGGAVAIVKTRVIGSDARIGTWATGQDFGSDRAGAADPRGDRDEGAARAACQRSALLHRHGRRRAATRSTDAAATASPAATCRPNGGA